MRNSAMTDETFDGDVRSKYHLSIQYCDQFCSFAILDTSRLKYIAFKNFRFVNPIAPKNQADHLRALLQSESSLLGHYKSVHFMYLTPVSVLVPTLIFSNENPAVYFKFSSLIRAGEKIMYRKIPAIDAFAIFPVPEGIIDMVSFLLRGVQVFHQSCPQIGEAISESKSQPDRIRVFANINPGYVDIMVVRPSQLLLYNSYLIRNTEDLVFFILYMYEQFSLSQVESPVILSGFAESYPGTTELLYKYLKKIEFREFPKNYHYSEIFAGIDQHHFSNLISLARCG